MAASCQLLFNAVQARIHVVRCNLRSGGVEVGSARHMGISLSPLSLLLLLLSSSPSSPSSPYYVMLPFWPKAVWSNQLEPSVTLCSNSGLRPLPCRSNLSCDSIGRNCRIVMRCTRLTHYGAHCIQTTCSGSKARSAANGHSTTDA